MVAVTGAHRTWRLGTGTQDLELVVGRRPSSPGARSVSAFLVELRLDAWLAEPGSARVLREVDAALGGVPSTWAPRWNQDRLLTRRRLAEALRLGRLTAWERLPPRGQHPDAQEELARAEEALARAHFFSVRLLDDATGEPIPDVRLEAALPDGSRRTLVTGRGGLAELRDVRAGSFTLEGVLENATLEGTLVPPGGGGATGEEQEEDPRSLPARRYTVLEVKEHRVKKGDTLARIAEDAGLTERALCIFNWSTAHPNEVQEKLRDEVGCTKKDEAGRYVFDDSDLPGVVYVPAPWKKEGLANDKRHDVRVRAVDRRLPDLRFLYQLDVDAPEAKNDVLTLEADDGSWRHEIAVSGLSETEPDWVELVFPRPPAGVRFTLTQDPKDGLEPFHVFAGVSYGQLRAVHAEQQEHEQQEPSDAA